MDPGSDRVVTAGQPVRIVRMQALHARRPDSKNAASPKKFFVEQLFHKRNRIVHFGEINFQQPDAELCCTLAATLSQVLVAMDAQRRHALEAKHSAQLQGPSGGTIA